ncbi:glycosyl hydrolase family 8 [Roseibacterium sp. SDUM158017]|uniref:glycosyl hydrolase family 8 n=1 Tax=Roseicyclus salinarum TaxID=3036773 RepID=UPI0024159606|nr:glycosyl hydrolase family 8 [Roseibacterium sp. SDUM158017]MDG4649221.1 glycosyl hydrolase family 8 [Roseibacterium sp. SDUM158017]
MSRRAFLASMAASGAALGLGLGRGGRALAQQASGMSHPLWPLWDVWRSANLEFSGRVIDRPQGNASHSEGQGYGMLLAAEIGDGDAFRRMADWTDANLAIRADSLLAWRWQPDVPGRVADPNNASDGDLFYAWALVRGAERFGEPRWSRRATEIAMDLAAKCIAVRPDRPGTPILLPAEYGFVSETGVTVNPSYMMPRAMREVAQATGVPQLAEAARSGLELMAQIASVQLVPDWLAITPSGIRPDERFSFQMGYEALRIPLFLAWSGERGHPALRRAAAAMADAAARLPAAQHATVIDARTGTVLESSADPGYAAITGLVDCAVNGGFGAPIPGFSPEQPYYPATLHMFALLSQTEQYPSCLPI